MTLKSQHETAEGGDGIDDEVGRCGLSHEQATGGVVGGVAHVDKNAVESGDVAKERHLTAPRACPRMVLVVGESGRSNVKTQTVSAFGDGGLARDFGSSFGARARF